MILGNSNHPVEIKKITVRIWKLRDEVEQVIAGKIGDLKNSDDLNPKIMEEVEKKYSFLSQPPGEVIPLRKDQDQAETEEENSEEDSEENEDSENSEDNEESESSEDNEESESSEDNEESESSEDSEEAENSDDGEETEAKASEEKPNSSENKETIIEIAQAPDLPADKISTGVCFLGDIDMSYVHFFSQKHFIAGQTIVVEFLIPAKFNLIAEVTRSVEYNLKSRIISSHRPPYRMSAKFRLERPGDRSLLRKFLTSVEPTIPVATKKKVAVQEEEDEFDDLDLD
jgi:flagellar biosynthesis GTPase FlhF